MDKDLNKQKIEEFLLVANEYCLLLENVKEISKKAFLEKNQKLLGLLYLKASALPVEEDLNDNFIEKFVTEEDWHFIQNGVATKLGSSESFFEVFTPETLETDNQESVSLSECLTDIYQDAKDIVTLYRIGNEDSLSDALFECKMNFERFWGPRLLASLSIMHNLIYGTDDIEEENEINPDTNTPNTDNWLINKRFNDFNEE